MKSPPKLLILIAVIVTVAVPAGWKWGTKAKTPKALIYTVVPAGASAPVSITAPGGTSANLDGWTWDNGE